LISGLATAALAEISVLTFVVPVFGWLLPIVRLLGFAWMICAGVLLPRTRAAP
jgi:hypothetical protein